MASDNLANVFIVPKFYTSKPPLSWCVRELALTAIGMRLLPYALHLPGVNNITADRLSRGFNGPCSLRALGLDPSKRCRPDWQRKSWWHFKPMAQCLDGQAGESASAGCG